MADSSATVKRRVQTTDFRRQCNDAHMGVTCEIGCWTLDAGHKCHRFHSCELESSVQSLASLFPLSITLSPAFPLSCERWRLLHFPTFSVSRCTTPPAAGSDACEKSPSFHRTIPIM